MPWKGEKDPYKIWLSEIILQQTRVEQGMPYYLRFVEAYPTVADLARAPLDAVLKKWQGLGYYSRARNLHQTAKEIVTVYGGNFPANHGQLCRLKGVGAYTAAAIASFAFDLPFPVVDGNVFRILSRYLGDVTPVDSSRARQHYTALAQTLLGEAPPAVFNQAIMDFGALQCVPKQPQCGACPLHSQCVAYKTEQTGVLPVKSKAKAKVNRYFLSLVFTSADEILVRQRLEKDVWQHLYDFPSIEFLEAPGPNFDYKQAVSDFFSAEAGWSILSISTPFKQVLSHQNIQIVFCEIPVLAKDVVPQAFAAVPGHIWIKRIDFKKITAVPRIIERFMEQKPVTLCLNK